MKYVGGCLKRGLFARFSEIHLETLYNKIALNEQKCLAILSAYKTALFEENNFVCTHYTGERDISAHLGQSYSVGSLQVCWGNYDTLTRHGLKVQKIKKGMAVNMKLAFAYCSLNLFNLTQPIPF